MTAGGGSAAGRFDFPLKLLRFTDVRERTGLSRPTVWRLERRGACPKHFKVSANIVA